MTPSKIKAPKVTPKMIKRLEEPPSHEVEVQMVALPFFAYLAFRAKLYCGLVPFKFNSLTKLVMNAEPKMVSPLFSGFQLTKMLQRSVPFT